MKKILFKATLIFVGIIMILGYFWHRADFALPHSGEVETSYYEIVKEDEKCTENCFLEYIVMSDGVVMEKYIDDFNDKGKNGVKMLNAGNIDANRAIESVRKYFEKYGTNSGLGCESCSSYHLYYKGNDGMKSFATMEVNANTDITDLLALTRNLAERSIYSDVEFFHFYYGKKDGRYLDYHIFSSGLIVREEFGRRSGQLLEAEIYRPDNDRMNEIKILLNNDFFNEKSDNILCTDREFLWGYVEVKTKEGYNYVYTCADGKKNSDTLFNYLYNSYD